MKDNVPYYSNLTRFYEIYITREFILLHKDCVATHSHFLHLSGHKKHSIVRYMVAQVAREKKFHALLYLFPLKVSN
jgi:hypothetical protein